MLCAVGFSEFLCWHGYHAPKVEFAISCAFFIRATCIDPFASASDKGTSIKVAP